MLLGEWCSCHLCSRRPVAIANLIVARTASMFSGLCSSLVPRVTEKVSLILPALATDIGILIVPPMPTRSFLAELLVATLTARE
ncbi:hypothetical protein HZ326_23509 [Fusarium oxysporum f. sp. albedinis]|nr:hypothetical protein HZ326_23509 [Fusarium oxysporum f. sp. albedinis]